ncbi:outer membrane protein assembly factor BamB family protein [Hymenobacter persicinus]|uniref:outer membrane protein assembly factor BamB family protein n=1 Tax=Hymenobacter persicinus TaxID=2025506 RepID=UPI0013EBF8F4|nr:PQQ-binding-like beta-propeller repeat protein [Hymenobacter persicinus]
MEQQGPYYTDAQANTFAVRRICEGKLMEQYASYRLFVISMNLADTTATISPEARESARLFMHDFFAVENAYYAGDTVKNSPGGEHPGTAPSLAPVAIGHLPPPIRTATFALHQDTLVVANDKAIFLFRLGPGPPFRLQPLGTVAVEGDVYATSYQDGVLIIAHGGELSAFTAAGRRLWHRSYPYIIQHAVRAGGHLYFHVAYTGLYCVEAATGQPRWTHAEEGAVWGLALERERLVVAGFKDAVSCFNPHTGALVWRTRLPDRFVSVPAVTATQVALNTSSLGEAPALTVMMGLADGRVQHTYATPVASRPYLHRAENLVRPALIGTQLVFGFYPPRLHVVDVSCGTREELALPAGAQVATALLARPGAVWFGSADGRLVRLALTAPPGTVRLQYSSPLDNSLSNLVASGNALYVVTRGGTLYRVPSAD